MLFRTRQKRVNIDKNSIVIDGNIVPFTTNTKFLGININNNLTWKAHINYITTKISKGEGVLLRLSKELSYILILIYNTILLPYLTYCCIIWGFTYQTYLDEIFTIKKGKAHNYSFSISMSFISQSQYFSNTMPLYLCFKN